MGSVDGVAILTGTVQTAALGGDITTAGKALLDDADAAAQRTTLGLGTLATQSGTFSGSSSGTNTGDVTLNGALDYLTIAGQVITRGAIDLATDVTGDLPFANLTPATAASRLLGRGAASGAGDFQEITLGTNLSMSGTTLNATGGGSDPWTYKTLPSDYTTTSATLATVTATGISMDFTPAANTNYEFEATLMLRTSAATNNPRTAVAWPTGMTDGVVQIQQTGSTATTLVYTSGSIVATVQVAAGGLPDTNAWPCLIKGMMRAGATPGSTLRIQMAAETAGGTMTVETGSFLKYRTV